MNIRLWVKSKKKSAIALPTPHLAPRTSHLDLRTSIFAPRSLLVTFLLINSLISNADPWVNTQDSFIRADIETLNEIGVIKAPISTYPLMWAGIVKSLDESSIESVPQQFKSTYWRVKKAAKKALESSEQSLSLNAGSDNIIFRSFGDSAREKAEIKAKRTGLSKRFAWNFEVSYVDNPTDNEKQRWDGSYLAASMNNWVVSFGKVERWWGNGWFSSNILSNNARPPLGISIQRNYSDPIKSPLVNWLGYWTTSFFVSELDDNRLDTKPNLAGLSFTFKPHNSLEIGLRVTSLFGGNDREGDLSSLIENFVAQQECDLGSLDVCDEEFGESAYSQNGDRLAGIDFRWRLPIDFPTSFYASEYGESESELFPSKRISQYGFSGNLLAFNRNWRWYIESSDTALNGDDIAYESIHYPTGYRYYNRAIGSTIDNESKAFSIGMIGNINASNSIKLTIDNITLNQNSFQLPFADNQLMQQHSLLDTEQTTSVNIDQIKLSWQLITSQYGQFDFSVNYLSDIQALSLRDKQTNIAIGWTYYL